MGAGAGAAATIEDTESSPRCAAIEKAQAELRRDLAVREERRRELEFLEKGGEILDFKFGEVLSLDFSAFSPTEPPVHPASSLKSEEEADVVVNGDLIKLSEGLVGAGAVEEINDVLVSSVPVVEEDGVECCERLGSLDASIGDPTKPLNETPLELDVAGGNGILEKPEGAVHLNSDSALSLEERNGHTLPEEVERVAGSDREVVELEGTVTSCNLEDEAMVEMSYQVLPHQSSHALSRKWNGLTGSQEYEPVNELISRCGPVLEQHASEPSPRDRASVPSGKAIQSFDVRVDSDSSSLACEGRPDELADRSKTHEQPVAVGEGLGSGASAVQVEVAAAEVVAKNPTGIVEDDVGTVEQATENSDRVDIVLSSSGADTGRVSDAAGISREPLENVPKKHSSDVLSESVADGSSGASVHRDARIAKKVASRGGSYLKLAYREKAGVDVEMGNGHHLRLKSDEGVAGERAKQFPTEAEPGVHETNGADSQELRTGAQAGATVGGVPRLVGRPGSISGAPNCKYPGVALPSEKEQDSKVQVEGNRHSVELREKLATKAREDFILEKAEHLKAKRKLIDERRTLKKCAEPSRRKSHWDFVLEEMKWMANDFWQERTWKRYQAAHVCLEIAMKKGEVEFLAAGLIREQRRVSSILARAVTDFWHRAEMAVTKAKSDGKSIKEQLKKRTSDSEFVPMDVDCPVTKETSEKSVRVEEAGKEQTSEVLKYAVQLLKEMGSARIGQAEAPSTPERYQENHSILEQVREVHVPLSYKVPVGAMEAYRAAVEAEHARSEEEYEKRRTVAIAEAEALAAADAAEDASAGGDASYGEFSNDGGSQDDEPAMLMNERSRISKKKRKKIIKTGSIGLRSEGSGLQGLPYRTLGAVSSELGMPSTPVTGKRSITVGLGPNSLPGSTSVKRARSSATNLRSRGTQPGTSPGASGLGLQKGFEFQSHQDDGLEMLDDSSQGDVFSDTPSSKVVGGDGKPKKKKTKTKSYVGLTSFDGGLVPGTSVKDLDGVGQEPRHEQLKRKADMHCVSIGGSDGGLDTPGASGSPGISVQQIPKKHKSVRQGEANPEAALTSGSHSGQLVSSVVGSNKLSRQTSMRDSHRRVRPKVPLGTAMGVGIPWSAGEDQAILALVHDLGPNWELVSDVLSSNSQLKGICRKPQQCKERHKALTERGGTEGLENAEDLSSSQPQAPKGIVRGPRGQSAAEEDTLKHFEQIVVIVQKYRARKIPGDIKDQKVLQASHPSHGIAISQFCSGSGGPPNPVQLADRMTSTSDGGGHPYPAQGSQANVMGPQNAGSMSGLGMRPPAGGLPLPPALQGTNGSRLGGGPVSPAAMGAAAARDAQRFTMNTMNLPSEDAARLQMPTNKLTEFNVRRAQQQAGPAASGVPVLGGLPSSNGLPMMTSSTNGGMLAAPNRGGLSLPRPSLGGMGPPLVSNMIATGPNSRLLPSPNYVASNMSRRVAQLMNAARNCPEEQRSQYFQQLQTLANQGEAQAVSALSSLMGGGDMMNAADGSNQQPFAQHQHSLQHQQQEQHQQLQQHLHHMNNSSSKLQAQLQQHNQQLPGTPQGYISVPTRMKEQQWQQHQQQHKQRLLGGLPANSQVQHTVVPLQPAVPIFPPQNLNSQSHVLLPPTHSSLQKHLMQQVSGPSQGAQVVGSLSLQSSPASPSGSGQQNEPSAQMAQSGKSPQTKQIPKQAQPTPQQAVQQQGLRNGKGGNRGAMLMHGVSPQTGPGQASTSTGNVNGQLQSEVGGQLQAGLRGVGQAQSQAPKAVSGPQAGSVPGGPQGGQGGQAHGVQLASVSSVVGQQKGSQQVQQAAQGVMNKPQQGSPSLTGGQSSGQQVGSGATSSQQAVSAASSVAGTQQPQQLHRRQVAQTAGASRRLPARHPGSSVGMPVPGQLGKTGVQQTGHGSPSQMTSQTDPNSYQPVGSISVSASNPNLHGVGLTSAVNSSTGEAQGTQWKANQVLPHLPGGMYNLTRTSSPGSGPVPTTASSGVQSNGNIGMSSLTSSGIQDVGLGNMAQGVGVVQGVPNHKVGGLGMNGRGLTGSQVGVVGGQRNPLSGPVGGSSGIGATPSSHVRHPTGSSLMASPTTSGSVGVSQGGTAMASYSGVSAASGSAANGGQARQGHGGYVAASSSSSSLEASSEVAGASGASGATNSGNRIPGFGAVEVPPSGEAAAASS
ncbi:chromatin modification-related protein EAF1 B isoform X3 [Physcomitrium patens]